MNEIMSRKYFHLFLFTDTSFVYHNSSHIGQQIRFSVRVTLHFTNPTWKRRITFFLSLFYRAFDGYFSEQTYMLLCYLKVHHRHHKSLQLDPVLNELSSFRIFTAYFS